MVLTLSEIFPIKNGAVLVTDGQGYATLDGQSQLMIDAFNKASKPLDTAHLTVADDPKACQMLGVIAVPSVFLIEDSKVIGEMIGFANESQINAFLNTGVSPC